MENILTEDQQNVLSLAAKAKTEEEKNNAIKALKETFPNQTKTKIRWSDGTVTE